MSQRLQRRAGWLLGAWMLIAPSVPAHEIVKDCPDCPRMVVIPGGTFTMGAVKHGDEPKRRRHEGPRSGVQVASFAIGETEVTRGQYAAFVVETMRPDDGGCFTFGFSSVDDATAVDPQASWRRHAFEQTDDHPVTCISWEDARDYAAWLAGRTGQDYRLPSEAEWEYAVRAGTTSTFFWGEEGNQACAYANGGDASLARALPAVEEMTARTLREGDTSARMLECDDGRAFTAAVGSYRPNAFGLYDMVGNVWEYVADCWRESLPTSGGAYTEVSCQVRRVRGGSWDDWPEELRSARRSRVEPDAPRNDGGFRLARGLSVAEAERIGK
jgi:sulfatase modifying factor 1